MISDKLCFLGRELPPADSRFFSNIRLKSPAKITFLPQKSSKNFIVVNCSFSVLALYKFITRTQNFLIDIICVKIHC